MAAAAEWFLWLIIYSFIGWVYESIVCSVGERKLVNRGFLNGPLCPVYGFGALVSIIFMYERTDNILLLFTAGMVLTCTVEYLTSVLLEKLFNARWWDYSNHRFHINGRVSLLGAVVFGALAVLLVKYIHPFIAGLTERLTDTAIIVISVVTLFIVLFDLYTTVRHILSLNGKLREIQTAINEYTLQQTKKAEEIKNSILEKFEESEFYNEHIKSLVSLDFQSKRIIKAFPKLRSVKYEDAMLKIKNIIIKRK